MESTLRVLYTVVQSKPRSSVYRNLVVYVSDNGTDEGVTTPAFVNGKSNPCECIIHVTVEQLCRTFKIVIFP